MSDEARKKILARRAAFVAAALATVACGKEITPQPCLSPPPLPPREGDAGQVEETLDPDAGPVVPPQPCLSVRMPDPPDAGPQPCLKIRAPVPDAGPILPPPQPCLSPVRPKDP